MSVFVEYLTSRGFNVIAPDLRGYGKFRIDRTFSMSQHIDDLEKLLADRGVDRCLILGWSLGGILAIELALRIPEKIVGLILIATAARPRSSHPPSPWWESVNTVLAVMFYRLFPNLKIHLWFGYRSLLQYLIQQHTDFAYRQIAELGTRAFLHTSKFATQALSSALRQGYDRRQDLAQIEIPCLVMAGEFDRHITANSSQETAELLSNSTWICYPNTAHLLPWEIPDRILSDIEIWLSQHDFIPTPSQTIQDSVEK